MFPALALLLVVGSITAIRSKQKQTRILGVTIYYRYIEIMERGEFKGSILKLILKSLKRYLHKEILSVLT